MEADEAGRGGDADNNSEGMTIFQGNGSFIHNLLEGQTG